jgi:hypothetical protein
MIQTQTMELVSEILTTRDALAAIRLLGSAEAVDLDAKSKTMLAYIRMNSLSADRLLQLMKSSILVAYEIPDFDLHDSFHEYLQQYDYAPEEVEICERLIEIIRQNQEQLIDTPIEVRGRRVPPTVDNFINDYVASSAEDPLKRDALTVLQYFNTSLAVRTLPQSKREVLKNVIQLYNYCNQTARVWELIPDNLAVDDLPKQLSIQTVGQALLGVDMEDLEGDVGDDLAQLISPEFTPSSQPSLQSDFHMPQPKDMDLSTQPKSGLVFDQPTNINMDEQAQMLAEEKRNQQAIQAKLEALKKRTGKDEEEEG